MIRRERRDGGGRRERIEKVSRERIEIERKKTKGTELSILKRRIRNIDLASACCQLPQGTAFLLSSRLDSAVKRCSSEVLASSGAAW